MTVERQTPSPNFPEPSLDPGPPSRAIASNARAAAATSLNPAAPKASPAERWLHRISTLMFVFVTAVAGVLLVILPWRTEWLDNHFLTGAPALRAFVANGFVRGLCSGLGLLDIWIGFSAAINYTDRA